MIRKHTALFLPALLLLGLVALAGCGVGPVGGASATATATPDAQTILQKAEKVQINDATYTLTFSGSFNGTTTTGNGNGKFTKNPTRSYTKLTLTVSGQPLTVESIIDGATNKSYSKISGLTGDKWVEAPATGASSVVDVSQFTDYSSLKDPKLVGTEQINGYTCWHITTTGSADSTNGTGDLFIRQDNYYPVEAKATTTGSAAGTFDITFTAINSGISIALPTPDQVQTLPS